MQVSPTLFTHTQTKNALLASKAASRLGHGLLITGPVGIGKATFCFHLAHALLGGGEAAFSRMQQGSHADFLHIAPLFDEKKEEQKREISVEQARSIPAFLSFTPAASPMRVVVVDSVDDLTLSAANALLKTLEEPPPNTLLLLVSHQPSGLLPTIRSRCQSVALKPPALADFRDILLEIAPEIGADDTEALGALTHYSPGLALHYHQHGALALYQAWREQLASPNTQTLLALADTISGKQRHTQFALAKSMLLTLLARLAKGLDTLPSPCISKAYAAQWFAINEYFSTAQNAHLDHKSVILATPEILRRAA